MSFKEKSIWGMLAAVTGVSILYFWTVLELAAASVRDLRALGGVGIATAVIFIVSAIAYHGIIAGMNPRDARAGADERDRLITLKGDRVAAVILAIGVAGVITYVCMGNLFARVEGNDFTTVNLLLLTFSVSEIGKYVCQLWHYRRGV